MRHSKKKTGVRAVAIAVAGSFLLGTATPSRAAETGAPTVSPRTTLATAASLKVGSLNREALAAAAQTTNAPVSEDSGGFFKSGKGKAALVLLVAASGFTVYSKYHDRIKSVIR